MIWTLLNNEQVNIFSFNLLWSLTHQQLAEWEKTWYFIHIRHQVLVYNSALCRMFIIMLILPPQDYWGEKKLCEQKMPKQTIKQEKLGEKTTWKLKHQLERQTMDEHKAYHDYLLVSFCLITAVKTATPEQSPEHLGDETSKILISLVPLIIY